jgi:hypothetical protein
MIDAGNPFWRPLRVRVAVTAVAILWGLFELATGAPGFALIFLAAGGYAGWRLLIAWPPGDRP